jgi:uncharacterized protein (TIGR03000 family)
MWKKATLGIGLAAALLVTVNAADAQRRGGRSSSGGTWGGSNWNDGSSFGIYTPGFGYSTGYGQTGVYIGSPSYYGGYGQYGRPRRGYYGGFNEPYYTYSQPNYIYSEPYNTTEGYSDQYSDGPAYASQGQGQRLRDDEVMIRVLAPNANAQIMFNHHATKQTGMERVFVTTLPERNKDFTYTVRATWTEDGREMKRERKVKVRAGQPVTVDLRKDAQGGTDINRDNNRDQGTIRDNRDNRDQGAVRDKNRDNNREKAPPPAPQPDRQP